MNDDVFFLSPKTCALIYRIVGIILYWIIWIKTDSRLSGFIAMMLIIIFMLIRWLFE